MRALLALLLLAVPLVDAEAAPAMPALHASLHVDPKNGSDRNDGRSPARALRTLEAARDAARALPGPWTGDVEILLHDGLHRLAAPLALTERDSGKDGHTLRFKAAEGATPILDGGREIEGWQVHDASRGIWSAPAPAGLRTRQLFVNGWRAQRARNAVAPDGFTRTQEGHTLPADAALGTWKNLEDLEFVYRHIWTNPRVGVAKVERAGEKLVITMRQPGFDNARNKGMTSIDLPWYLENAYELLDEPGEWYLDTRGTIGGKPAFYYMPHEWENMRTARSVVPVLERLVSIEGSAPSTPVERIAFHGLTFEHATWLRPSSDFGVPDAQNNVMRENFEPDRTRRERGLEFIADGAALHGRHARSIHIERCRFQRLGGIGVALGTASQGISVVGSTFRDISANAIQIGDYRNWQDARSPDFIFPSDPALLSVGHRIENNFIDRCAVEFRSSTAIGIALPRESVIAHNEIRNMPYSGIHLGWGWNTFKAAATGGNRIERNFIRNVMVELADGGSVYTLGASDQGLPHTVLTGNHSLGTRWGQGFYFDESSSRYRATDNVFERISDANIKINGKENHDIEVRGLYADKTRNLVTKSLEESYHALLIEDVRPVRDAAHRAKVDQIRSAAGLQPAFASAREFPADPFILEFEEGDLSGPVLVTSGMDIRPFVRGYGGMAYVDQVASGKGAAISLPFTLTSGGRRELRLRYAAGGPTEGLVLVVNGRRVPLGVLPPTAGRSDWSVARIAVELVAGANTVALLCESASPHFFQADRLVLAPIRP